MSTLPPSGGAPARPQHPSTTVPPLASPTTRPLRRAARTTGLVGAVAAAALVLSACGGQADHGDSHSPTSSTSAMSSAVANSAAAAPAGGASADPVTDPTAAAHNDADIAFAQGMIVHHRGAIEMAASAADRAGSDAVRSLADRIEAAQTPEIDLMTGWLQSWSAPVPTGSEMSSTAMSDSLDNGSMDNGSMDHGSMDHGAVGMMSPQDMAALESATGADFDRRFLELMIVHHEGAVTMSQTELEVGQSSDALALARTIIDSQTAEIAEMRGLLAAS